MLYVLYTDDSIMMRSDKKEILRITESIILKDMEINLFSASDNTPSSPRQTILYCGIMVSGNLDTR